MIGSRILSPLLLSVLALGCAYTQSGNDPTNNATSLISKIQNTDIRWDGNFFGLQATVGGSSLDVPTGFNGDGNPVLNHKRHSAPRLIPGNEVIAGLLAALRDEKRFVSAHVLLTEIFWFKE